MPSKSITSNPSWERKSLILQGILAVIFGLAAVFMPTMTAMTIIYLFTAFLVLDGVLALIMGLNSMRAPGKAFLFLLLGLIEVGFSLFLLQNLLITFGSLIMVVGLLLVIRGLFGVVGAMVHSETAARARMLHAVLGVMGILAGLIVAFQPLASGLAFVWILGLYALIAGPILVAVSFETAKA